MRNTITATLLVSGFLAAQEPMTNEQRMAARDSAIEGELGFDFTSQYFFRGILQDKGFIVQPWLQLGYDLLDADSGLRDLRVVVGQWNSLSDGPNGSASGIWYESRFYLGLEAQVGERLHLGARHTTYSFPSVPVLNAAGLAPIQDISFYGRFDDAGVFSDDWSLQPTVLLAFELDNQRDFGNDRGIYTEIGVAPSFEIGKLGDSDVTLSLPAKIGLSLKDYYERIGGGGNEFFGFMQVGAVASMPLNYLPARLGPWQGDVGLHFLVLGDNNDQRNGNDAFEAIFTVGMSTAF